jgi:hypothetical protein
MASARWGWLLLALGSTACGDGFAAGGGDGGAGASTSGAGGDVVAGAVGCADDSREYLDDAQAYPSIAGCQGAWNQAGVDTPPQCMRGTGNNSKNPNGLGCAAADLCAPGWHLCATAAEVGAAVGGACPPVAPSTIWITRQTTNAMVQCVSPTRNNVVGCGTIGQPADPSCAPLDVTMLLSFCNMHPAWACGTDADFEADNVVKTDPSSSGGVLCCLD